MPAQTKVLYPKWQSMGYPGRINAAVSAIIAWRMTHPGPQAASFMRRHVWTQRVVAGGMAHYS